jgi:hypothetical protein
VHTIREHRHPPLVETRQELRPRSTMRRRDVGFDRRVGWCVAVVIATTLGVLGVSTVGFALHRYTPRFVQVTSQTNGDIGRGHAWVPDFITFESNGDVVGNGNAAWQIFLFDLPMRDYAGQPGLTQVTFGSFIARYPTLSEAFEFDTSKAIISFEADGDLCSDPRNNCDALASPTTGRQVFAYVLDTRKIRQITSGPGDCRNPQISGFGRYIVFESATDLLGNGAVGAIPEVYKGDVTFLGPACPQLPCPGGPDQFGYPKPRGLERITTGGGWNATVNYNGRVVAFESRGDLGNSNLNPGVQQIYVVNRGRLRQITEGPYDARGPSVNSLGARVIAFEQDEPAPGGTVTQVKIGKMSRTRGTTIIFSTDGASSSVGPRVDSKGFRIAFSSTADLLGDKSAGSKSHVFLYDRHHKNVRAITQDQAGGDSVVPMPYQLMAFASSDDIAGTGNTTRQLFVANYFEDAPSDFITPFPGTPVAPGSTPNLSTTPSPTPTETQTPTETPSPTPTP